MHTRAHVSPRAALLVVLGLVLLAVSAFGLVVEGRGGDAHRQHADATSSPSPSSATHGKEPTRHGSSARPTPAHAPSPQPTPPEPTTVKIPAIGVDSPLVDLGLNEDGTLEVPADPALAGWYMGRPVPGEPGPAVIAGHVDSETGPAVFFALRDLEPGHRVEVGRADGSVARFQVVRSEQHDKDSFPTERVYGPTGESELRLITCGGQFDRDVGHYEDNIVVFARLQEIVP